MKEYLGHESQLYGVEEHRLIGGKGDGMRLLQVKNGCGLEVTISPDRCADIARLSVDGCNFGYFAPCGYVSPQYYDGQGNGFLKSFTAGFLTTCGLSAAGAACEDEGESVPLHGNIGNTPAEACSYTIEEDQIIIRATVRAASLFGEQLLLKREYVCPLHENMLTIRDTVKNIGSRISPLMMLYHFNVGYPLLSEKSQVVIPYNSMTPRNERAAETAQNCLQMEKPQRGFVEQCYYYDVKSTDNIASVGIYNPAVDKGMVMSFDKRELDCFTEWKMMGEYEYVLGLEPGNCFPDGRAEVRRQNKLKFIEPGQTQTNTVRFVFDKQKAQALLQQ